MKAVKAGSFDSWTKGHGHVLRKAMPFFDEIHLAVGVNSLKSTSYFSLEERLSFLRDVASDLTGVDGCKLSVGHFVASGPNSLYQVDYAQSIGAKYIIRGLRNPTDYQYETDMMKYNKALNPRIETMFFVSDSEHSHMSSSWVRALIGPQGWHDAVKEYLPMSMWDRFISLAEQKQKEK